MATGHSNHNAITMQRSSLATAQMQAKQNILHTVLTPLHSNGQSLIAPRFGITS